MDPATLALIAGALGSGLVTATTMLLEKGVIDPALEKGLAPIRKLITGRLDTAVKAAAADVPSAADLSAVARNKWLNAISDLYLDDKTTERALVATAASEMVEPATEKVSDNLLQALKLNEHHRPLLAEFLFRLRKQLVAVDEYEPILAHAERIAQTAGIDQLYGLFASVTTETSLGRALRVQVVPDDIAAPDLNKLRNDYFNFLRDEYATLDFARYRPAS